MSQIVRKNPYDIPKIATGIRQLDLSFYGGLPKGSVVLITGKTGEGKSVFTSQILLNAIDGGHKCFAYSGELPDWAFQSIIDFQAAGSHVYMTKNKFGIEKAAISETNEQLIGNWYEDLLLLYDDTLVEDESETEKLTETIEKVILQEGVEVILLDNLMTGIELDGDKRTSLYERQSSFVKSLARIAKSLNVLILLVAHMRKNNGNTNGNDEVAGSSDITNLASITLMYESSNDLTPDQRYLKIWKDRLFGHRNTKGIVLDYDEKSRRIYGVGDDVNKEYGWVPEFEEVEIPDEIPFE
jgi:KaiC/GvpD/RAD55 family RecA-like ATPase